MHGKVECWAASRGVCCEFQTKSKGPTEDDGSECLESEFRELSAFPCAIPNDTMAHEFVSAGNDVQALADITDAEEADSTGAVTTFPTTYCSRACVSVFHRSCGTVHSTGFP